jgi:hypothetical protein
MLVGVMYLGSMSYVAASTASPMNMVALESDTFAKIIVPFKTRYLKELIEDLTKLKTERLITGYPEFMRGLGDTDKETAAEVREEFNADVSTNSVKGTEFYGEYTGKKLDLFIWKAFGDLFTKYAIMKTEEGIDVSKGIDQTPLYELLAIKMYVMEGPFYKMLNHALRSQKK